MMKKGEKIPEHLNVRRPADSADSHYHVIHALLNTVLRFFPAEAFTNAGRAPGRGRFRYFSIPDTRRAHIFGIEGAAGRDTVNRGTFRAFGFKIVHFKGRTAAPASYLKGHGQGLGSESHHPYLVHHLFPVGK
jgi:hypothetical protein